MMSIQRNFNIIFSILFHPLLIPLYGLAVILSANSPFGFLPFHVKRLLYIIIIVNNVLLPLSLLPFLMHMNFITSWSLNERDERTIPLLITTILYATSSYIFIRFPIPGFLKVFIISVFIVSLFLTLVNLKWKISLHSAGIGSLIGLILILSFRMYSDLFWYFLIASVAGGIVLSARLRFNIHSPRQVWYGLSAGYVLSTFFLLFLQQFI